ncbi:glycosyltransferase family 4 protein [Streptomyces sp. NPDC054796]
MELETVSGSGADETEARRGRVVMLVCNGVAGDSRVQKAARSAAEAGWDVTLLGRSPDGRPRRWKLGEAEVRLLPVPMPLARRPHQFRRAFLTRPLAYRPGHTAAYRMQRMKAWRGELFVRGVEIAEESSVGGHGGAIRSEAAIIAAKARLLSSRAVAKAAYRWVAFRKGRLDAGIAARRRADTRLDRLGTSFWIAAMGKRSWRKLWPMLHDFELAYGKVIDELRPDLIHANDFRVLGAGARAKLRARAYGRDVKLVWDAHEFLPGVRPWNDNARWLPAHMAHEREYVPYADAAVTVSDSLAHLLRETHGLPELPTVVLNAPSTRPPSAESEADAEGESAGAGEGEGEEEPSGPPDLRELCGVDETTPLLVYSGGAAPQRGLATMVEALPLLEGAHVVFVVPNPRQDYVRTLLGRAAELGVEDRVHAVPYVPFWQVVPFLSRADVGVIPIHHWVNHELALITKFFEYAHARLPLVVSDVRTMALTTRETGQGEVFRAEDVEDYARAVRAVLADPARYRAAYDRPGLLEQWTWEAQADILDELYTRLLPHLPPRPGSGAGQPPRRTLRAASPAGPGDPDEGPAAPVGAHE